MIATSRDKVGFDLLPVVSPSSFLLSLPFLPSHFEKPVLPPPNRFLRIGNSLLTAEVGSKGSGFSFWSLFRTIEERFEMRSLKSSVVKGVFGLAATVSSSGVFLAKPNHPDFFLRTT